MLTWTIRSYTIKSDFFTPPLANDVEGNDTPATASQATMNGTMTGHLGYFSNGTTDMDDYWKFTVPSDGKVVVHVTSDSVDRSGATFDLAAYGPDTTSSLVYDGRYGTYSRVGIKATAGLTYYFRVNKFTGTPGSYSITATRSSLVVGVEKNSEMSQIPRDLFLDQNYPNPFNPSTVVQYGLPASERVRITIFSLLGQEIAEIANTIQPPGSYRVVWNGKDQQGKDVPSGIYLIRLQAGSTQLVKKAMLVR